MADRSAAVLAFFHDIVAGREAEFEEWFQHEHLPERIAMPGFVIGRRYEAVSVDRGYLPFLCRPISRGPQVGCLRRAGQRADAADAHSYVRDYKERVSDRLSPRLPARRHARWGG